MGGTNTKPQYEEYGEFYIETSKEFYFPGETVVGNIHLHLRKEYPGKTFTLRFKGKEQTHFIKRERSMITDTLEYNHYIKKHSILDHQTEYLSDMSNLAPRHYTFPFSFTLPQNIPATFFEIRYHLMADISYQIQAIFTSSKDPMVLKYSKPIVIRTLPVLTLEVSKGCQTEPRVVDCCRFKGCPKLSANFDKNIYMPGETAQVTVKFDNSQCKLDCINITFNLTQILNVTGETGLIIKTTRKETYSHTIVRETIPGIGAGKILDEQTINVTLPAVEVKDLKWFKRNGGVPKALGDNSNTIQSLSSGTEGKLIKSEFFLEVIATLDVTGCGDHPKISMPVEICPPLGQIPVVQAPQDWNPLIMNHMYLSVPGSGVNNNLGQANFSNQMQGYIGIIFLFL